MLYNIYIIYITKDNICNTSGQRKWQWQEHGDGDWNSYHFISLRLFIVYDEEKWHPPLLSWNRKTFWTPCINWSLFDNILMGLWQITVFSSILALIYSWTKSHVANAHCDVVVMCLRCVYVFVLWWQLILPISVKKKLSLLLPLNMRQLCLICLYEYRQYVRL